MTQTFAAVNMFGAVMIAFLMMISSPQSSVRRSIRDPQAMWALLRRALYICIAGGLMGMGLWTFEGWIVLSSAEAAFWLMVSVPIGLFLIIRAARLVDQDRWVGFHPRAKTQGPTTVHDVAAKWRNIAVNIQNPKRRDEALDAAADLDTLAYRSSERSVS